MSVKACRRFAGSSQEHEVVSVKASYILAGISAGFDSDNLLELFNYNFTSEKFENENK